MVLWRINDMDEQEKFERDMEILSKNLQETTKNFSKAMQSRNAEDIKNAREVMRAAQEAYDNRLKLFNEKDPADMS